MKVFILGAGFSCEAGYPLAKDLLSEVGEQQLDSKELGRPEKWRAFEDWRAKQIDHGGPLADICQCANPEYLLTYLDLASMAVKARWDELWSDALSATRDGGAEAAEKRRQFQQQPLSSEESEVSATLLEALYHFLGWRHHRDWGKEAEWAGRRLVNFFDQHVKDGDVVVSFNYDAVAERCLLKFGKWHPSTGYGFPRPLASDEYGKERLPAVPSAVSVLKLHGSVGWRRPESGAPDTIILAPTLLQGLGVFEIDSHARPGEWRTYEECIMAPSFVKLLHHPILAQVWSRAAEALGRAEEVIIIGYSLPLADSAATALLATTLSHPERPVVVVDPQHEMLVSERWERVLSRRVVHKRMKFREWVEKGCPTSPNSS